MKIITWNMRRSTSKSNAWDYLTGLEPDIALLQEVNGIPESILADYNVHSVAAITQTGNRQNFKSVILSKYPFVGDLDLRSAVPWVNDAREFFNGNIIAKSINANGHYLNVVNAYSPAWIVPAQFTDGIDITGIKLTQNPFVWGTEILWKVLC